MKATRTKNTVSTGKRTTFQSSKTKASSTIPSNYKTGVMKKRKVSRPISRTIKKSKTRASKGASSKRVIKKPFEYTTEESEQEDVGIRTMASKFDHKEESPEKEVKTVLSKVKGKKKKIDPKTFLINKITEIIKNKGEFKPEDLDPEVLKEFQDNHKLVGAMQKMGIQPTRVNLVEDTTDESDGSTQKMPGNNKVKDKFKRKNRYGVYGDNNWEKLVDVYYNNPLYKKPEVNNLFQLGIPNERFDELDEQVTNYINLSEQQKTASKPVYHPDHLKVEDYEEEYTNEHLKYEKSMNDVQPDRKRIFSKESDPKKKQMPGIVNSQKKVDDITTMHKKRRTDSAVTIQRVFRGHVARQQFKKLVHKKNIQDEEDYGYFEVTEQGVRQYLDDRRRRVEDEKLKKQAIRDLSPQKDDQDRFMMHNIRNDGDELNIFQILYNKSNGKNPFDTPERSMVTMADTPPKSRSRSRKRAIEKYAEDLKNEDPSSSIKESLSTSRTPERRPKTKKTVEDDYSDDFEDESIRESIRESIMGSNKKAGIAHSYSDITESIKVSKSKSKKISKFKDSIDDEILEESIARGALGDSSASYIGTAKKSKSANVVASSGSIKEDISGSGKFTPRLADSIHEEIIGGGEEDYSNDFESLTHSKGKQDEGSNKYSSHFGQPRPAIISKSVSEQPYIRETHDDILLRRKLEKKFGLNVPDRAENLISDLINAKGIYENSSTALHMVDKFERMLALFEANSKLMTEKARHLGEEKMQKEEINRIREEQIAELIGVMLTNKSDLDAKQVSSIISKQPISKDLQSKINENLRQHETKQQYLEEQQKNTKSSIEKNTPKSLKDKSPTPNKSSKSKHLRFLEEDDSAERIHTDGGKKQSSMFAKARLRRTKPLTEQEDDDIDLDKKLNDQQNDNISESIESVPYSDNFEASASIVKSKSAILKTKDSIDEDIPEAFGDRVDSARDTITEKIGDDYSSNFDEISESIHQSKNIKNKLKPARNNKLNSKYSTSRVDEESISEEIEESIPMTSLGPKQDRKLVSKPNIGGKKSQKSQNALLDKLQDSSTNMNDLIRTLNRGVEARYKDEVDLIVKEFSNNKISDREYSQKKKVLEAWREKELVDIEKKRLLIEGWVQMGEVVSRTKNNEDSIGASGSLHDLKKAPKHLFSKPDYSKIRKNKESEESDFDPNDDSEDSIKLRRAKKQLRDLENHENRSDSADENIIDEADIKIKKKTTKKKTMAANKLLEEKEKAIQEGLKQKIAELEEEHAQDMLEEALKVDVKKEIEHRYNLMLEVDAEQKEVRRRNEAMRQKRLEESLEESSIGYRGPRTIENQSIEASQKPDIEDSATSAELNKMALNFKAIPAVSKDDDNNEDIIQESLDEYSNDFTNISQSASIIDTKPIKKVEEKKVDEIKEEIRDEESEIPSEINEDYSEDFEESAQINNIEVIDHTKPAKVSEEIKEENTEDEELDKMRKSAEKGHIKQESKDDSIVDETPIDTEENDSNLSDEIIDRVPTGKSDELKIDLATDSGSSADVEVVSTDPNVDWVLDVPVQEPIKKEEEKLELPKEEIDDIDEEYSDSFEDLEQSSDKNDTPKVGDEEDDVTENPDKLADIIAEELFKSIDT